MMHPTSNLMSIAHHVALKVSHLIARGLYLLMHLLIELKVPINNYLLLFISATGFSNKTVLVFINVLPKLPVN